MSQPDRRLNAYREDLAESCLKSDVIAGHYTDGTPARISLPCVPSRQMPDRVQPRDTEFLFGESITVLDHREGWAWVKSRRDGYVGYIDGDAVAYDTPDPTHKVTAIRSHLYPASEVKRFAASALTFGALVTVVHESGTWSQIADGQWIASCHIKPINQFASDPVETALRFLEVPYLWGGRSSEGLDCSALVQFSLEACGISCLRDSDMQEETLGSAINMTSTPLRAADLIYWPGHVAMMIDESRAVHSNATDMATKVWEIEGLKAHILKIEGTPVRTVKRL